MGLVTFAAAGAAAWFGGAFSSLSHLAALWVLLNNALLYQPASPYLTGIGRGVSMPFRNYLHIS